MPAALELLGLLRSELGYENRRRYSKPNIATPAQSSVILLGSGTSNAETIIGLSAMKWFTAEFRVKEYSEEPAETTITFSRGGAGEEAKARGSGEAVGSLRTQVKEVTS